MKTLLRPNTFFNFIVLLLGFSINQGYGQVTGEYRTFTSGNWTDPSSWEYYDGSAWIAATDYPGLVATNRAILIGADHIIADDSDITNSIGTLTINGQLVLRDNTDNFINTTLVIVDPVTGSILFDNKSNLNLPIDSAIQVTEGGLDGNCTNNNSIFFGPIEYAACTGQSDLGLDFDDITDAGGTGYATSNSPVCAGTANKIVLYAIPPLNGGTYTYTWYDSPAPSALSVGSGQNLILEVPLLTGQYNYLVKMESEESGGITLYVGTVVDVIAGVPTNITYDVTQSCDGSDAALTVTFPLPSPGINYTILGVNPFVDAVTNTTGVFSDLAVGTYALTVSNEASCSSNPEFFSISPQLSKTWDGAAWSPAGAPTSSDLVTINGDYSTATYGTINACSLIVNAGKTLTISPNTYVLIENDLTVNAGGNLIVENNANLIQTNTVGNTGVITVKRNSNLLSRLDYTMWSSPVSGQPLQAFSPETLATRFYVYNPTTDVYNTIVPTTNFVTGTGYLIRMPNNAVTAPATQIFNGVFTGTPNNGLVTIAVTPDTYNAVGNPYPSTIDANLFMSANGITSTVDALYFWRKINCDECGVSAYATYTAAGGTASPSSEIPNGTIQVGQGFIVKSTSASLVFNNSMRVINNDNQFFKTTTDKSRIWLNLTNTSGFEGQMMLAYMDGATMGIDAGIDGKYFNDSQTALTSIINTQEYVIQGRPLPFVATDVVPLSFKCVTAEIYTIAIDHMDGLFASDQTVYLKDNLTNTTHNLNDGAYSFISEAGVFNARFEIVYQTTLAVNEIDFNENDLIVYQENDTIRIISENEPITSAIAYDSMGRVILKQNNVNENELNFWNVNAKNQLLILKIVLQNGKTSIRKTILY